MIRSFAAALLLASALPTLAQEPGGAVPIKAVLDYGAGEDAGADAFFAALSANAGKVVQLELEIIPSQDPASPGYSLTRLQGSTAEGDSVVCGDVYGVVDNSQSMFLLDFQHPQNSHSPTRLHIGDRLRFPFHAIRCGVEDYTTKQMTHLHVSGQFVVMAAEIPTAISYELFPYFR